MTYIFSINYDIMVLVHNMKDLETGIQILKQIEQQGYSGYIVGGAVRDYLLGLSVNDIDIATNMPIEVLKQYFDVLETGISYAGVTISIGKQKIEITQFRKDLEYVDHRHPKIELVDTFKEDSKRRDFTINALALDKDGNILDYWNGQEDLNRKIIRTIGDPNKRFEEDALRILRGLYLSSKLDFIIEEDTLKAIINKKHLLSFLSNERIYDFFVKILYCKGKNGYNYIEKYNIFEYIEEYKKWFDIVSDSYRQEDLCIYYYMKYGTFPKITSNEDKKKGLVLKKVLDSDCSNYVIYENEEILTDLIDVLTNLGYREIVESLKGLKIHKKDLLAVDNKELSKYYQGKMISVVRKEIIRAILDGRIENKRKSIIIFLKGLDVIKC